MKLEGKVALITGGARGMGRSHCLALAREGADIVTCDICKDYPVDWPLGKKNELDETIDQVQALGRKAIGLIADISKGNEVREMVERAINTFGRIDILVNNAAFFSSIVKKPFYQISAEEWDAVIGVNLKGLFLCSKAVYPQMKKQRKGKIINVSSGTFFRGLPHFLHYVTSKGGVIGFTRALAREVGDDGIRVNAIAPGYTETEILRERPQDPEEVIKATVANRCIKRTETPEDLAGTIVFLASDDSDFITGQTILVDGGSAMS